ncbi:MAG: lysophospholipid acyltransferase family protein [Candidatus Latescibacterota bacterium]
MDLRMNIIAFAGSTMIRALGYTWKIRTSGENYLLQARSHHPSVIFAFWHGRMLPLSFIHRGRSVQLLVSEHRDGEMMGRTVRLLGYGHVRGSSTRGGARAIRELVAKIEAGSDLAITVDGPKGPKFVVKPGPLAIAKLSGAAIVPITASSGRQWSFNSWDTFEVPKLFTCVSVRYGEPVFVPADTGADELESKRLLLESTLRDITSANDETVCKKRSGR